MNLLKRITDIVKTNLNEFLEKTADPILAINQIIREMETHITVLRQNTTQALTSQKLLEKKNYKLNKEIAKWEENAILAIQNSRDDLAKRALGLKNECIKKQEPLASQIKDITEIAQVLKTDLFQMEEKVQEARRKREGLIIKKRAAESKLNFYKNKSQNQSDSSIVSAESIIDGYSEFKEMEEDVLKKEAMADAWQEVNERKKSKEDDELLKELNELKKKIQK
ncbi:MAG: hypothetical protein COA79_05900 [Planctomycetota bacterium]|nr:MAG: hypothetical protein COA79_05900 [Planctomycetota bacterium]